MDGDDLNKASEEPNEANKIKDQGLIFVFSQIRDNFPTNPCPYYDDGNPDMYTAENMKAREDLKKNEVVRDAINDFIKNQFNLEKNGDCTKEEYYMVFSKICMILRPGIDSDDMQRIIKEDFENDSMDKPPVQEYGGAKDGDDDDGPKAQPEGQQEEPAQVQKTYDRLDKDKLYDSLYTMADTWCPDIDEFQYKEFFS